MEKITIQFPDGRTQQFPAGVTALEIAESISPALAKKVLAAEVNGQIIDATRPIQEDARIKLLTWEDSGGKYAFWHSSAHLLAEALEALYPGVKFGIGPPIEEGFYYDVDLGDRTLSAHDLEKIEQKMLELARRKVPYLRREVPKEEAIAYFKQKGDPYKLELLEELQDGEISFYTQGNFTDLCKGPHIPHTGLIKAVKLTKVAGAYWRGDENRPQLTRVYGISFPKQKLLQEYLHRIEEAKKRDHRKLGKELELFTFSQRVGAGLPIWLPRGTVVRQQLMDFLHREQQKRGYQLVVTPHIGKKELYQTSGHWDKYGKDSFRPIKTPDEGEEYLLKPMNCPHHCEIYASKPRSYRELPLRIAEFGTVYRYEQSGELHGLTRVRCFTQDDAHIFCTPEQLQSEFLNVLELTTHVLDKMGFKNYTVQISLRDPDNPQKYIGSEDNWQKAEQAIIEAVRQFDIEAVHMPGEAAFYGPKLDFMVRDALGRQWQLGTIQVDYNLPERFNLEYIGADNQPHRPVMIHRAPFGSLERFISILLEHTAGKLPLWLAPDQVVLIPVSDPFIPYCKSVLHELQAQGIRAYVDERSESMGKKIRESELKKIPFILICGQREEDQGGVSVRIQGQGDKGFMPLKQFIDLFRAQLQQ